VPSPIASRRLELFAAARTRPAEFIRVDPSKLRFHLGTSAADVRVPVEITREAMGIVTAAANQLAMLLTMRHKRLVPQDELDQILLRDDFVGMPNASPWLTPSAGGSDLRAAAQMGPLMHPALTGGVVCAWMGPGGRGRSLTGLWIEMLRQGFAEMSPKGKEETPLLVALVLTSTFAQADAAMQPILPQPPFGSIVRGAVQAGLWIGARTGLVRACRDAGRAREDALAQRVEAVLSPLALMGGRQQLMVNGSSLYGCELGPGFPKAEEVLAKLAAGVDADSAVAEVGKALADDKELARRAELAVAVARFRELFLVPLAAAEAGGRDAPLSALRDLWVAPGALAARLADDDARKTWHGEVSDLAESAAELGEESVGVLEQVAKALKGFKVKEPGASLDLDRDVVRREYAAAAVAALCDQTLERMAGAARKAIAFRTGTEAVGGTEAEYEAGRLYRVGARTGPILKVAEIKSLGHLFVDVKDFTRRTGLLGQAAMADFLRREFYLPILDASKRHYAGLDYLQDRGGVSVNNLLGDALSMSGAIEALVAIARDIRHLLSAYEQRLAREVSSEGVAKQVAQIEAQYGVTLGELSKGLNAIKASLAAAPQGTPQHTELSTRANRLYADYSRQESERQKALAKARGEGLEAGVFIAFGPPALIVNIEDEVFGNNRVAIADKINESARGTARSGGARSRADAFLAAERVARRNPSLQHAWSVFVGAPLAISISAEAEEMALRAARGGDMKTALMTVAPALRDALDAAVKAGEGAAGDIYNNGAALSEPAMLAYLDSRAADLTVRRVAMKRDQVPLDIRDKWFFMPGAIQLVVTFTHDGKPLDLFRFAGKAAFKGLADVPVWELCAATDAPAALLKELGAGWFKGQ
jgi:hypothetical protein